MENAKQKWQESIWSSLPAAQGVMEHAVLGASYLHQEQAYVPHLDPDPLAPILFISLLGVKNEGRLGAHTAL